MDISSLVKSQHHHFSMGKTLDIKRRKKLLGQLYVTIQRKEKELSEVLYQDLGKDEVESYLSEIGIVLSELRYTIKHLFRWTKRQKVKTPLSLAPAQSYYIYVPYGVTLILSPWNYPFQLTMIPLIGAIAAGNTAIIKPSAKSAHTSAIMDEIVTQVFDPRDAKVVMAHQGNYDEILHQPYNYIFFTGSTTVGKKIMKRASEDLIPLTLELGGKSPTIVDESASIALAAKRIVFGKMLNAGQTCVAPDFIIVHKQVKEQLLVALQQEFEQAMRDHTSYPSIISDDHYSRLLHLLEGEHLYYSGPHDPIKRKIHPTILDKVSLDSPIMKEEIFGPLLPVLSYSSWSEVETLLSQTKHPLACYVFSERRDRQLWFERTYQFGGGCINDTLVHVSSTHLPFGGVGHSGMGSYHGKKTFETFSHAKSIVHSSTRIDVPIRYRPYTTLKKALIRRFLR